MYSPTHQATTEQGWVPVSDWRFDKHAPQTLLASKSADWMHHVPTLSSTVLGLDLILQEQSIDLQVASELVLSDFGATIQVLKLIGHEYRYSPDRPATMHACLASLEVDTWFTVISSQTLSRKRDNSKINSAWSHCRTVGQYAKLIAETLDDVSPEEAYMVGLLHEIESIPQLLDNRDAMYSRDSLTVDQVIPQFVLSALESAQARGSSSVWRYILSSAHALAAATSEADLSSIPSKR
jgi:HD-like signal output (HDOD) protein